MTRLSCLAFFGAIGAPSSLARPSLPSAELGTAGRGMEAEYKDSVQEIHRGLFCSEGFCPYPQMARLWWGCWICQYKMAMAHCILLGWDTEASSGPYFFWYVTPFWIYHFESFVQKLVCQFTQQDSYRTWPSSPAHRCTSRVIPLKSVELLQCEWIIRPMIFRDHALRYRNWILLFLPSYFMCLSRVDSEIL